MKAMCKKICDAGRPAEILLVEDSENDAELTRLGFSRCKLAINLHHVEDGEQCMAFLRKQGEFSAAPTPDLVLLDLNMPRMDGFEVLREVARDDSLKVTPIVVLTSSDTDKDVLAAYNLRCASYIKKPVDFLSFSTLIQSLTDYWFALVVMPAGINSDSSSEDNPAPGISTPRS